MARVAVRLGQLERLGEMWYGVRQLDAGAHAGMSWILRDSMYGRKQ